jgi:hypothetical protein
VHGLEIILIDETAGRRPLTDDARTDSFTACNTSGESRTALETSHA